MDAIIIQKTGQGNLRARRIVNYIAGLLEILLACRLVFKLLGANPQSPFVSVIYSASHPLILPFVGIFRPAVGNGVETQSVVEPGTIIAMIVYALVTWGIVRLIKIGKT